VFHTHLRRPRTGDRTAFGVFCHEANRCASEGLHAALVRHRHGAANKPRLRPQKPVKPEMCPKSRRGRIA
jgi:hypothetical protein